MFQGDNEIQNVVMTDQAAQDLARECVKKNYKGC